MNAARSSGRNTSPTPSTAARTIDPHVIHDERPVHHDGE
jgi:hypothetical protein